MGDRVCRIGSWTLGLLLFPMFLAAVGVVVTGIVTLVVFIATRFALGPTVAAGVLYLGGLAIVASVAAITWNMARDAQPELYAHCRRFWGKPDA